MGADGRWADRSLAKTLYAQGQRFDFYQAVKLLELLDPQAASVATGVRPEREAVRFQSTVGFGFTGTDIATVEQGKNEAHQATMQVNFMGLAGALGPLPAPYTELLMDRLHDGDSIMRDFLDIFNHRLVSLMYRVRKIYRIGFAPEPLGKDRFASYMYALIGLGTDGLRNRMAIPDNLLLRYAGLLAQYPRSAAGLECMLKDYFHVRVQVHQFRGQWLLLDADQWTAIGITGRNQVLGESFLLGKRIYDKQGKLELRLGPLDLREFLDFLPIGHGFRSLGELARFYLDDTLDVDLRLTLKAKEVPGFRIGGDQASRLSWTSWLKTMPRREDEVVGMRLLR